MESCGKDCLVEYKKVEGSWKKVYRTATGELKTILIKNNEVISMITFEDYLKTLPIEILEKVRQRTEELVREEKEHRQPPPS